MTPRVHVLASTVDGEAARLACLLEASTGESLSTVLRARPELVLVRGDIAALRRGAWVATAAGAQAVLALPVGFAAPLPWWGRRYQRFVFAAQPEALLWVEAGTSLGRVVVVEREVEARERAGWEAVVREVLSMGGRPAGGRAAR